MAAPKATRSSIVQFVVQQPSSKHSIVQAYTADITPTTESQAGRLFGLAEFYSHDQQAGKLADLIFDELEQRYYQLIHETERQLSVEELESHFEFSLQKVNIAVASFLETRSVKINFNKVNIVLGILIGEHLVFTHVGSINIFLLKHRETGDYRIIDVLQASRTPDNVSNPLRTFTQIITGTLKPLDVLAVMTENILDYFSQEKIKQTIAGRTLPEARVELNKLFVATQSRENVGVILAEVFQEDTRPRALGRMVESFDYHSAAKKDSMRELNTKERATEKLLTPSLIPEFKKYRQVATDFLTNLIKRPPAPPTEQPPQTLKTPLTPEPYQLADTEEEYTRRHNLSPAPLRAIGSLARRGGEVAITGLQRVSPALAQATKQSAGRLLGRFRQLPLSSQVLLILAIILAGLFGTSLFSSSIQNQKSQKLEAFNQGIVTIEQRKNDSLASLIYRDESQARDQLNEALTLLEALTPATPSQDEQKRLLKKEIERQLLELQHIVAIPDPIQVINFANLNQAAVISSALIVNNKTILAHDQATGSFYQADPQARTLSATDIKLDGQIKDVIQGTPTYILTNSSLFAFDPQTRAITGIAFTQPTNDQATTISLYNNRLYLAGKNMYRAAASGNGFGAPEVWSESTESANVTDISVDGSIYALFSNGVFDQFINAQATDFTPRIDPPLVSPTKLFISPSTPYMYILDPGSKRLIITDKTGKLVAQYTAQEFTDLKDFVVFEAEKEMYVLSGSILYGIPAKHLE